VVERIRGELEKSKLQVSEESNLRLKAEQETQQAIAELERMRRDKNSLEKVAEEMKQKEVGWASLKEENESLRAKLLSLSEEARGTTTDSSTELRILEHQVTLLQQRNDSLTSDLASEKRKLAILQEELQSGIEKYTSEIEELKALLIESEKRFNILITEEKQKSGMLARRNEVKWRH